MAIDLPAPSAGSSRRLRAAGVPDSRDVRPTPAPRDPGVAVPQGAFDGATGAAESLSYAGERLAAADQRIRTRENAVARVKDTSAYNQETTAEELRIDTEGDWSSPDTLNEYGQFLTKRREEILNSHKGSADSKADLEMRLETIYANSAARAGAKSVAAQRRLVTEHIGEQINSMSSKVIDDPSSLSEMVVTLDSELENLKGSFSPEYLRSLRQSGLEQIGVSAVSSMLNRGGVAEAEAALATPGFAEVMSPDTTRKLKSRITVAKAAHEKARMAGEMKVNELRAILGREPTAAERAKVAGVAPSEGRQTLSGKIGEFEQVMGRPATEQEISKIAGVAASESGAFGAGITGRALGIMTDDAPAFAGGLLSEDDERRFLAAVTQYTQPVQFQNPDTGIMETSRPELPMFVQEALRRRGIDPQGPQAGAQGERQVVNNPDGSVSTERSITVTDPRINGGQPTNIPSMFGGQELSHEDAIQRIVQAGGRDPETGRALPGFSSIEEAVQAAQARSNQLGDKFRGQQETDDGPRRPLWQRSGNIAGPVPTAAAIAGKTPGVGSLIGPQEIAQDRAYAVGLTNDIVRVLQNSPRFAEMERAQIKNEVGLEPGTFDTPTAFRDRIIAVDELLEERQNDAIKTIQNRTMIGKEDYQRSLTLLNDIANIRARLGVPPRVKSASEVRKMIDAGEMKSGDQFIDPNGIIRSIP